MMSGANPFPVWDTGPVNRRDGEFTGPLFPEWGDKDGNLGQLVMLRMEAVEGSLPAAPILLRKSVESYLGVKVDAAYPEARGASYVLKLRNKTHVEKLKQMSKLADGFAIRIVEHPVLNVSKCVISCSESCNYSDTELLEELQPQGVKEIRRITKVLGESRINTPTIILTVQGTTVPQNMFIGWIRCPTRHFYPSPMLCYCCWVFGHTRARCTQHNNPTCGHCSQKHVIDKDNPCTAAAFCIRCNTTDHPLSSRKCPIYIKEEEIQHLRVDMGISYPAAKRQYDLKHSTKSMASVVIAGNDQRFADLSTKLDNVLKEMKQKDNKIEELLKEIRNKDAVIESLQVALKTTPQDRLNLVKDHGTIQDLVDKVRSLERDLARKDREIETIRSIYVPKKTTSHSSTNQSNKMPTPDNNDSSIGNRALNIPSNQNVAVNNKKTGAKKKVSKTDSFESLNKRTKNRSPTISDREDHTTDPIVIGADFSSGDEPMLNASGYISDT